MKFSKVEPYRPFFISGFILSILGVGMWHIYQHGWLGFYPMESHGILMFAGFIMAYVYGFLMTAVPKMSQTDLAKPWEIVLGLIFVWLQVLLAYLGYIHQSYLLAAVQFAFILFFVMRRFFRKKANPPLVFVFIPFGLIAGLAGSLILSMPSGLVDVTYLGFAKILIYQGFVLNLICGLGSRLIPALCRVQNALDIQTATLEKISHYILIAVMLNLTFVIEAFWSPSVGNTLKFIILFLIAVKKFKLFHPRSSRGYLGLGLRVAVIFLALGFLLSGLFSSYAIHFQHLSYIAGIALLTILISTRVVLAHGGHDLSVELTDSHLKWFFSIFVVIAFARLSLAFVGTGRGIVINILFLLWIFALAIWGKSYLKKLIFSDK